jgi:glycosyltransferase involved in cell wall biosynthesis
MNTYNLVHITTDQEYKAPLVASQLFDQAEFQAINPGIDAPNKVEAWIIGSMREYFNKNAQLIVTNLQLRCPHIQVRMINGIGKLNHAPLPWLLKSYRKKLDLSIPVIYHCRGTSAVKWAKLLTSLYPQDRIVVDIRGYWPAESLYNKGIEDPALATGPLKDEYNNQLNDLKSALAKADGVTTVSNALRDLLIHECQADSQCSVIPCCVSKITDDSQRSNLRASWGIAEDEILVVYSGTTAAYQHLGDLTIPFMKQMAALNPKVKLAFFSSQLDKIKELLKDAGVSEDKVLLKSFAQSEVGSALTACDGGILIRKPTLVNRVANPVKIAEYLAAGLPIIIEKGVGGVADVMFEQGILFGLETTQPNTPFPAEAIGQWLEQIPNKRSIVRTYVSEVYLWSAAIHVSRKLYKYVLNKPNRH